MGSIKYFSLYSVYVQYKSFAKLTFGASFSVYRKDLWPVPGGGNLTFRGIKNLDATLDWALQHGMASATEVSDMCVCVCVCLCSLC